MTCSRETRLHLRPALPARADRRRRRARRDATSRAPRAARREHPRPPHRPARGRPGRSTPPTTPSGCPASRCAGGQPATGDAAVDEAADRDHRDARAVRGGLRADSYDAAGAPVSLTVHYGRDYANAFWDGTQLVFGDGDGGCSGGSPGRWTCWPRVHPRGHRAHRRAGLPRPAGALNESVSDVFAPASSSGCSARTRREADWLIGEGIFVPGVEARALRDMAAPGTAYDDPALGEDPQPGHMDDYVETDDDNGGVHLNSGIPNRAFLLAATAIGGTACEGAGRIWYAALTAGDVGPTPTSRPSPRPPSRRRGARRRRTRGVAAGGRDAGRGARAGVPASRPAGSRAPQRRDRRPAGEGEVDLDGDDRGRREVRDLLDRVDLARGARRPAAARQVRLRASTSAAPRAEVRSRALRPGRAGAARARR